MASSRIALFLVALFSILFSSACSKLPDGCDRFEEWKIISEKDKDEVCIYQQIYLYKGAYYSVCECCVCDKAPMAVDCNDQPLCDFTEDCMTGFYKSADYLFSAEEE